MRIIQENCQFTVRGPLNWYDSAQVRMWIILDINYNHFYYTGKSSSLQELGTFLAPQNRTQGRCDFKLLIQWTSLQTIVLISGGDNLFDGL